MAWTGQRRGVVRAALLVSLPFCLAAPAHATVTISSEPTASMTCSAGVCAPTAKKAVLNVNDLAGMLASGDVTVMSGQRAMDIDIAAALSWTSTSRLTLDSYHSINFEKPLVVAGSGALTITTNDGGSGGDFQFLKNGHVEFWDGKSGLIINGAFYRLAKTVGQLAKLASRMDQVNLALAKSYDAATDGTYDHSPIPALSGSFEGLGNTISHLSVDDSSASVTTGFFGYVGSRITSVRDFGLVSVNVHANGEIVGALAQWGSVARPGLLSLPIGTWTPAASPIRNAAPATSKTLPALLA